MENVASAKDIGSFGAALIALHDGKRVSRKGWHLGGMYLLLQFPDVTSKMTLRYIYLTIPGSISADGQTGTGAQLVPWLASQTDMLATDWEVIE